MPLSDSATFGALLRQLRKRAGMTQADLAAVVGYSHSFISNLELGQRLPDLQIVMQIFIPALGLQNDQQTAMQLVQQAAIARGEHFPAQSAYLALNQPAPQVLYNAPQKKLPTPPTALVGRSAAINQLCNRLLGHSGRLLTLVGAPGIGKTQLALAVAARLQAHFAHGVVFVPLAAASDATVMASTIMACLGQDHAPPKSPQRRLIESLRHQDLLLVLDNCEQIHAAPALIAEIVAECPGLRVLATSRERLHLRAEQRYKVPPLALDAALELFVQRAQAVDADFVCTRDNQPILAAICQRLDCLPLALELCAAQIELFSPGQLLHQLQDRRLDLLVDGAHDLPIEQRALRHAIGRSYALLNGAEQRLLRRLSVFAGGFDLAALALVGAARAEIGDLRVSDGATAESLPAVLRSLVSKSLVRAETVAIGEQRFGLLETIREFALEQLRAQGEEAEARHRHFATYLQRFRDNDYALRRAAAAVVLTRLQIEQDNLRAALHWAYTEARYEEMAWLLVAANWFWFLCDYGYERGRWLQQLLPHRATLMPAMCLSILIGVLNSARVFAELQPIDRYVDEIMPLLAECPYKLLHAVAWFFLAQFTTDMTQTGAALARSVALARVANESPTLGPEFCAHADRDFILPANMLGVVTFLIDQGEVSRATALATESLQLFRSSGNQPWIIGNLGHLGRLALLRGDLAQAHSYFDEVVTLATTQHYRTLQGEWQPFLGIVILYQGDRVAARHLLAENLPRAIDLKQTYYLARNYTYLAELALCEAESAQAAQWVAQSVSAYTDPERNRLFQVERLFVAARLATAQQQYQRAATLFGLAEQMHGQIHHVIGGPMRALADAALATVQAALEPAAFAEAFAAGQAMTMEDVFATILPAPIPNAIVTIR